MIGKLPAATGPGYTNNIETTGALDYERTNYDFKLNYATQKLNVFGRYGNSPHLIDDQYALGEAGGGSSAGGSVGVAVGRTQILGLGMTYVVNPTTLIDANFGMTHQVLGAEAPDLGVNVGSDPDKMNIPGTNGPDRLQGGLPSFQIANWSNLGNDGTGNPFNFRDNQYQFRRVAAEADQKSSTPRRHGVARSADQSLPAAGRDIPDGPWHVHSQRAVDHAPERSGAGRLAFQFVGGVSARRAVAGRQGRSTAQPELDLHEDLGRLRAGHVAGDAVT